MAYRKHAILAATALATAFGSGQAFAQSSDDNGVSVGDIIVTARRTEERLQDVPISMTVFSQEQLTQRNIAVATDLAAYTPSLSVNQRYGPEKASFSIRGFIQDQSTAPTVGVYFAEVVGVRAQGGTTSGNSVGAGAFTDLENVQVLKGPQGTLFGRNTTGGAILLTPKRPTGNYEGYVEGTYGNYDQKRLQAAVNVPLADTFKIRAAVEKNSRDGYMKNRSGIGPKDYNDVNYLYGRLSILAELTPDLENYTVFHYSDSDTNGYASKIVGCAQPGLPANMFPLNTTAGTPGYSATRHLQAASCAIQLGRQTARGDGLYDVEVGNANPFLKVRQWQAINTTTWNISDNLTLKNIMSYGEFRERANFDLGSANFVVPSVDPSPFPGDPRTGFLMTRVSPRLTTTGGLPGGLPLFAAAGTVYQRIVLDTAGPNSANSQQSTFTEELQLQGQSGDGKLKYVLGGYIEMSRPTGLSAGRTGIFLNCTRPQDLACTNPLYFGSISESATRINFDNNGIFAQGTYNFTEQLALTGGIRYTMDKITGMTQSTRASLSAAGRPGAFQDPLTGIYITRQCTDSFRFAQVNIQDQSACITRLKNKSNEPTWLINLDYKPNPDMLLYAKYARGYRQGGMNFTNPGLELWGPEQLDSYEVGAKTTLRGAVQGYVNVAGFYNDLKDAQFFAGLTPSAAGAAAGVAGGAAIINAGSARSYGIEVDALAVLFDNFSLSLGYTYLNTKVKQVATAAELAPILAGTPFGEIKPRVSVGSPFNDSPKHKLTVGANYTLPLDESAGKITLGATFVHSAKYINDGSVPGSVESVPGAMQGIGLGVTPASDLLNLNLDWKGVAGSPIDLAFFVTNVTKEKFNVNSTGAWTSAGVGEVLMNQPRFYGVRVRFNFGQ